MGLREKILEIMSVDAERDAAEVADEIVSSLNEFMIPKDKYNKQAEKLRKLTDEFETANSELVTLKEKDMSAEEKIKAALDKAESQKLEYQRSLNKVMAEKTLAEGGLKAEQYEKFLDGIVTEDQDKTISLAQGIIEMLNGQKTELEKSIKADILKDVPRPQGGDGNGSPSISKERFQSMSYMERVDLANSDPDLYKQLKSTED